MKKILSLLLVAASAPWCATTVSVSLDTLVREIDGFGASSAWYADNWQAMPEPRRSDLIDALFDTTDGIGLSILRNRLDPGFLPADTAAYDWTGIEHDVWLMREVRKRGCTVFMTSPWTPPGWMKTTGKEHNGGSLKPEWYARYARMLADYTVGLDSIYGTPLYTISVQNEPYNTQPWETCVWTAQTFYDFVEGHLIPTFTQRGVEARLMAGERWKWTEDVVVKLLDDPQTRPHIDIVAAHEYKGRATQPLPKPKQCGKRVWMTEDSEESGTDIGEALIWAEHVHTALIKGEANAFLYWWLVAREQNKNNASLAKWNADETNFFLFKRAYTIGNFSRFVRPGFHLVGGDYQPLAQVRTAAFVDQQSGRVVVVVVNQQTEPFDGTLAFDGGTVRQLTPWATSATEDLAPHTPLASGTNEFTIAVPAQSVYSLVGTLEGVTGLAPKRSTNATGAGQQWRVHLGNSGRPAPRGARSYDMSGKSLPPAEQPRATIPRVVR